MVAPVVLGALAGGQIGGSLLSSRANKKAARQRARAFASSSKRIEQAYGEAEGALSPAYDSAIAQKKDVAGQIGTQAEQTYAAQKELWAPWMVPGMNAMKQLDNLLNDPSSYEAAFQKYASSPQFKFKMDESTKAMRRQAAVSGNRMGGAQMAALSDRAQDVAGTEFNSWLDRLTAGLSGMAQTGMQATGAISNAQSQLGQQKIGALQYGDTSAFDIDKAQQLNALKLGRAQDISNLEMGVAGASANATTAQGALQSNLISQLSGLGMMGLTSGSGGGALSLGNKYNTPMAAAEGFSGGALSGGMRVT